MPLRRVLLASALSAAALAAPEGFFGDAVVMVQQTPQTELAPPAPPAPPAEVAQAPAAVVAEAPKAAVALAAVNRTGHWYNGTSSKKAVKEEVFDEGEVLNIRIDEGALAGTQAPALVKSRKPNGRYHLRVATRPISTELFNVAPGRLSKMEQAKAQEAVAAFQGREDAAKVAAQLEKETQLLSRAEAVERHMNTTELQHWMAGMKQSMERELVKEAQKLGCPAGFQLFPGSGRGSDHIGSKDQMADSAADCGSLCSGKENCKSFHWSPSRKQCWLDASAKPASKKAFKDFMFCGKAA